MPRDYRVFLQDVQEAIANITEFISGMTRDEFEKDRKTLHAVIRNLEVIGEAVKSVPVEIRLKYPQVPWSRIAGLRDILIHHYFQIDIEIVWDIVQNKLPELDQHLEIILGEKEV